MKQVQLLLANHTSLLEFSISVQERRRLQLWYNLRRHHWQVRVPSAVRIYRAARPSRLGATTYLYKLHNFTYD